MKSWKLLPLAGVLFGVTYLPGPFLLLSLVAFLPLLWWLERNRDASIHRLLGAGFVFGWVAHLIVQHFMYSMLRHSWLAGLLYLGFSLALAVRISLAVALLGWLRRRTGLSHALLLPMVWLSFEWIQGQIPDLRMTGEHVAHTLAGHPFFVQFADLVGPYGVTAVVLAINGLLFEVVLHRGDPRSRHAGQLLALLVLVVLAYDAWAWNRPDPERRTLRVGLVQPNIPLSIKHDRATRDEQWETLERLSRRAADEGADLIIWPESARPDPVYFWLDNPRTYSMPDVSILARELGVPMIVGVEYAEVRDRNDYDLYNAVMAVDAAGRLLEEWGAKVYLVPFVEATPFRSLFGSLVEGRAGEWHWLAGGFRPGPQWAVLPVADTIVGVVVCYEQLFPDPSRQLRRAGSEVQVVITNDAWFGRSLFQAYQANALRLRAIENRTAYVRVANTGISGFVDDRGRYRQMTRLFEEAVEVRDVSLSVRPTVYSRIGDVAGWASIPALLAAVFATRRRTAS